MDTAEPIRIRYLVAWLESDKETMSQMAELLERTPGHEGILERLQAHSKLYLGQVRASRGSSQEVLEALTRGKKNSRLAEDEAGKAFADALLGDIAGARRRANASLKLGGEPAMALALTGDTAEANKIVDKISDRSTEGGYASGIWIPEIRAAIALKQGNAARALELLEPVKRYEAGWADNYQAAYLRGQADLATNRGGEAALEFQKILDHRGVVLASLIGPLARVGLARSYAMQGDARRARLAYEQFFELWSDADKDIPILIQAKAEYAKLH